MIDLREASIMAIVLQGKKTHQWRDEYIGKVMQALCEEVEKWRAIAKEILSWDYRCFKPSEELSWFEDARDKLAQALKKLEEGDD